MTASGRLVDYMKAVRIHEFGGPETLKHEDVQLPAPAAGEVLVHACASGVNPVDWKVRAGYLKLALCSLAITVCNFAHVLRPRGITASLSAHGRALPDYSNRIRVSSSAANCEETRFKCPLLETSNDLEN
jgi:hypothetical protein